MLLQIQKSGSSVWGTLRTEREYKGETAHKYLLGQQNDWVQNGGPEFVSAKYRIGDINYQGGEEVWDDYHPKVVKA